MNILRSYYRLFITLTLILLALAACAPAEPPPTDTPPPPPTNTPPPPEPEPTPIEDLPGPLFRPFTEAEDRDAYQVWNLDDPDFPALQQFLEEYEAALHAELAPWWVQTPHDLALYFVYTVTRLSAETLPYQETFFLPTPPNEPAYIIIFGEYLDDSVWGDKIRMELRQRADGLWEVAWMGNIWRCRRGGAELEEAWHTTLCP